MFNNESDNLELLMKHFLVSETDSEDYKKALEYIKQLPPHSNELHQIFAFMKKILMDESSLFSKQRVIIQIGVIGPSAQSLDTTLFEYSTKLGENSPLHTSIKWALEKIKGAEASKNYQKKHQELKQQGNEVQHFFGCLFFGLLVLLIAPFVWSANAPPNNTPSAWTIILKVLFIIAIPGILVLIFFSLIGMLFGKELKLNAKNEMASFLSLLLFIPAYFIVTSFQNYIPKFSNQQWLLLVGALIPLSILIRAIKNHFTQPKKDAESDGSSENFS